jgi:tetratricopeptide (TPR) repeat protein/TolB-like protein
MSIVTGTRLGPYEVVGTIGAGGMGEVYRARDTRLGRDVAVKVLPAEFAADPERLRRFEQEAKAVAALNHPNILAIFDVGVGAGLAPAREDARPSPPNEQGVTVPFIVTELLEGESLRDRMRGGALPVRKAVETAVQIAQGLSAAHEKGIVHRDLKPANVFVTNDGQVKILDFGIAKLTRPERGADPYARTLDAAPSTDSGAVLGTMGYISPEQLRGQAADARSDIFSFGCVLYEMLSGRSPFLKGTGAETVSAILTEDPPPLSSSGREVPPALQEIVHRCLEKRPEDRFSSAHDLALALRAFSGSGDTPATVPAEIVPRERGSRRVRWVVVGGVGLAALVMTGVAVVWLRGARTGGAGAALDPGKIMVGEFENMTGDRSLDSIGSMVGQAVSQGLVELGDVEVISAPPAEEGAGQATDVALRTAARAAGAGTLVSGTFYLSGDGIEVRGRVSDVGSGKLLFALKPETGPRASPAEVINRVRQRVMGATILRSGDGVGVGGVKVPPLFSAYQEYIAGMKAFGWDMKAAITHLEKAAALDPDFWRPQIVLAFSYKALGNVDKFGALNKHLLESQDRFGPADLVLFEYQEANSAGRPFEAYRKARELLGLDPRDWVAVFGAASLANRLNRPREALSFIGDLERIDWKTFGQWRQGAAILRQAALAHHQLGEYKAELAVAELGERHYPDLLILRRDRVRALAALGRVTEVDRVVTDSLAVRGGNVGAGDVMEAAAMELRAHGHADDSRRLAVRCAAWFAGAAGTELGRLRAGAGQVDCLWLAERFDEARRVADQTAEASPNDTDAAAYRGILAARAGDRPVADAADRYLAGLDPIQGQGNPTWLRACIAAQRGDRDGAVELLRESVGRGFSLWNYLHTYVFLEPLHGYPPFEELIRPQG